MKNMKASIAAMAAVTGGMMVAPLCASQQPNLVLILVDDLGWGEVGYHGGRAPTPHIDRMSEEGLRFNRMYSQPICTPSRTALLTGRYPWRSGMASGVILNHLDFGLPLEEVILANVLKDAGYSTAIIGKWHLGHQSAEYLPTERGFDYHYGLYTAIDHFTRYWQGALDWHRNRVPVREDGYATNLLAQDTARLIDEHDFGVKPLFLYSAMFAPHDPNQAIEQDMALFPDVTDPEKRARLGLLVSMDRAIGTLLSALAHREQLENTFIFFVSDNGGAEWAGADNGPLRGSKGTYYEAGIRVPAIAFWPGKIQPGTTDALAYLADIFPTFASVGGATLPDKELDGYDLSPILFEGKPSSGREEIVFMLEDTERLRRGAIIQWPWKLLRTAKPDGPWVFELFQIEEDPYEKNNAFELAKEMQFTTRRLSERLDKLSKDAPPAKWKTGDGPPPPDWKAGEVIGPDAGSLEAP
jgi:arylsulfatase A-like enzyme